jgi:hypothetical protein
MGLIDWDKHNDLAEVLKLYEVKQPRCGAHCGNGWAPRINKLISDLIAAGWDKNLQQIKEKFGGLRFYIDATDAHLSDLIGQAESDSLKICELCGEEGKRSNLGGYWIKTLCDKHAIMYAKE